MTLIINGVFCAACGKAVVTATAGEKPKNWIDIEIDREKRFVCSPECFTDAVKRRRFIRRLKNKIRYRKSRKLAFIIIIALSALIFFKNVLASIPLEKFENPNGFYVCFTPGENCELEAVSVIDEAQRSVYVQEYHITSPAIVNAITRAWRRGLDVKILIDKAGQKELAPFRSDGVPSRVDRRVRIAHNKVIIIDSNLVVGGSYNLTKSAHRANAENMTFTYSALYASKFLTNFNRRWEMSK